MRGHAAATPLTAEELYPIPSVSLGPVFAFLMGAIGACLDGRDRWDRVAPLLVRRALRHGAWIAKRERALVERLHARAGR